MAILWTETLTTTPINNATEGGDVIMIFSVEGGTALEIQSRPLFGDDNWAQTYIMIYAGNGGAPTRYIEPAVVGSAAYSPTGGVGRARTMGFARKVTVLGGERSLHVVARVDGSASPQVWRRYPFMSVTLLQTYR